MVVRRGGSLKAVENKIRHFQLFPFFSDFRAACEVDSITSSALSPPPHPHFPLPTTAEIRSADQASIQYCVFNLRHEKGMIAGLPPKINK
jgi:hypothetical protein